MLSSVRRYFHSYCRRIDRFSKITERSRIIHQRGCTVTSSSERERQVGSRKKRKVYENLATTIHDAIQPESRQLYHDSNAYVRTYHVTIFFHSLFRTAPPPTIGYRIKWSYERTWANFELCSKPRFVCTNLIHTAPGHLIKNMCRTFTFVNCGVCLPWETFTYFVPPHPPPPLPPALVFVVTKC